MRILTIHVRRVKTAYEALRAGASEFLLKDAPEVQLVAGIRIVADGGSLSADQGDIPAHSRMQRSFG